MTGSAHAHRSLLAATLLLFSLLVFARNDGLVLPERYRTPLSDLATEDNAWRAPEAEANPWRAGQKPALRFRKKAELFPEASYKDSLKYNPPSSSMLQNADELERAPTNIFRYRF